jgi:hypothetical protein
MVSKLLLAVGENIQREAVKNPASQGEIWGRLVSHYRAIREGIGSHKLPDEYGAFPFDPYSHTPTMTGVQQPGMTGQVKEDIISRWFELGVSVHNGQISFAPTMLSNADFNNGELRFTYCGTEIVYKKSPVTRNPSPVTLTKDQSAHLFARDGELKQIIVEV